MNRYFERIQLNALILSRSAIRQRAELSKCGGGWLAIAVVCVKGKEGREVSSGGENRMSVHERDIKG